MPPRRIFFTAVNCDYLNQVLKPRTVKHDMTVMGLEEAQILALRALAHVLHDERTRDALLVQTGVAEEDLRRHASQTGFLAGILRFLLDDERRAREFCGAESVDPASLRLAHAVLSGHSGDAESAL